MVQEPDIATHSPEQFSGLPVEEGASQDTGWTVIPQQLSMVHSCQAGGSLVVSVSLEWLGVSCENLGSWWLRLGWSGVALWGPGALKCPSIPPVGAVAGSALRIFSWMSP